MPFNNIINRTDAGPLIDEEDQLEIVQGAIESSVVMTYGDRLPDLATNKRRMKVLDTLPLAYFVNGDTGLKQTTDMSWTNKYLDVEEIAVILTFPEAVIDDAEYDIIGEAKPRLKTAFGQKFDKAVIHGTDAPASWPLDLVAQATAAGNVLTLSAQITAGNDLYDVLLGEGGSIAQIEDDGYFPNGHVGAITMKSRLRGVRDTTGQPIFKTSMQAATGYELDGSPMHFPRNGAIDSSQALLLSGDWSQLKWAMRQDMTYKILTEGVITDDSNNIVYNLAQQDMIALRAVMRIAWQVPNPINYIEETEANRYPFSVLLP